MPIAVASYARADVSRAPTSGLAIASLVFALVGFVIPLMGLGGIALSRASKRRIATGERSGAGLAMAGLIVGVLSTLFMVAAIPIGYLGLVEAREHARQTQCLSNARQLSMSLMMYSTMYKGFMPPDYPTLTSSGVMGRSTGFSPVIFCPAIHPRGTPTPTTIAASTWGDYIYTLQNQRIKITNLRPANTFVTLYEASPNHPGKRAFTFADGSCRMIDEKSAVLMIQDIQQGINPPNPH